MLKKLNPTKRVKVKDDGIKELRQLIKDLTMDIKELRESQKKTDEQMKKTDEQIKKTDTEIDKLLEGQKKTDKQIGNLTDGWGKFVEGLVAPSLPKLFKKFGLKIRGIDQRALRRLNGRELEIDILCVGEKDGSEVVIAAEVKSNLEISDVEDYLNNLSNFFKFFKEYRGRDLIGMVSGIRLSKGVKDFAERHGLYVLAPSGETMIILNKKGFKPRIWR